MKYIASVSDFFRSPKWMPNLLLGGLCMLIPIVGPMVVIGWHSAAHFGRRGAVDYENYPAFNFDHFSKHLERGVWPFLVNLAASVVMVPLMWVLMVVPMGLGIAGMAAMEEQGTKEPPVLLIIGFSLVMFLAYMACFAVFMLVVKPLMIRAAMTQDFAAAFNFKFMREFTRHTWLQQIAGALFLMVAGLVLMMAGMLVFCVGMYAAISLTMFTMWHLDRQLYDLYLARGGEPVPVSPKISDQPPPLVIH